MRSSRTVPLLLLLVVVVVLAAAGCQTRGDRTTNPQGLPDKLRVGVIPNVAPDTQRAHYDPFRQYLERTLNTKVELFVATDYAGVVNALVSNHLDVAYLGGLTYVQAEEQAKLIPLVTEIDRETGTPRYLSAIVVRKDAPYRSVQELLAAKASFAFGDVSSTSGSLYPRLMLVQAGARCSAEVLEQCPPLSKVTYTGGHDATAQAVLTRTVDAGGLELRILHRLEREGSVPPGSLRVIQTHQVMGYPWVARAALGPQAQQRLADAFTRIHDPRMLDLLRAKAYVKVTPADYNELRTEARNLGLLTPSR
jgi:phosphonate transport system substrate-binding protein